MWNFGISQIFSKLEQDNKRWYEDIRNGFEKLQYHTLRAQFDSTIFLYHGPNVFAWKQRQNCYIQLKDGIDIWNKSVKLNRH